MKKAIKPISSINRAIPPIPTTIAETGILNGHSFFSKAFTYKTLPGFNPYAKEYLQLSVSSLWIQLVSSESRLSKIKWSCYIFYALQFQLLLFAFLTF